MNIVIPLFILVFVIITLMKLIIIVRQSEEYVVERFGRFNKTLKSGLNILIPYADKVAFRANLREQVHTFEPQPMITKDNATVNINAVTYFRIMDPHKAYYSVVSYEDAISQFIITTLRNLVGELELDETLTSRNHVNNKLQITLDEVTNHWGIKITRVEVKEITPLQEIAEAMSKQMVAERTKRAAILSAEGQKQAAILSSEGQKQAAILYSQGKQEALVLEAKGQAEATILKAQADKEAMQYIMSTFGTADSKEMLLVLKYLEMLPKLADGKGTTLVVPEQLSNLTNISTIAGKIFNRQ
ncbi:MAG: SPFH/Band 7/PHB domain protein [Candidatus Sericytochromatia bacterium]|nr:SPFH/Band 7/PHB domain protein [Candidatus Sericytochromatia bacterium]